MKNNFKRIYFIIIYFLARCGSLFCIYRLIKIRNKIYYLTNKKFNIFLLSPILITNKIIIGYIYKFLDKKYINENTIFNKRLEKGTLYLSAHIGHTELLYKIFKFFDFKILYIRSFSFSKYDISKNRSFYDSEFIFKDSKKIIEVYKNIKNNNSVYVCPDGSKAKDKLYLTSNHYIKFSNNIAHLAIKEKKKISFIICNFNSLGKIIINITDYDYKISFEDWYRKMYLESLKYNPLVYNQYRIKIQ